MPRYHLCFSKSSGYVLILASSLHPQSSVCSWFTISSSVRHVHLRPCTWGSPVPPVTSISSSVQFLNVGGPSELWTNPSILLMPLSLSLFLLNCHDSEYPVQVGDTYVSISSLDFSQLWATVISDHLRLTCLSISTLTSLNHFSIILFQRYIHCSKPIIDFMLNYMDNIPNPYKE